MKTRKELAKLCITFFMSGCMMFAVAVALAFTIILIPVSMLLALAGLVSWIISIIIFIASLVSK